jgi:uncharacterized membrane protein
MIPMEKPSAEPQEFPFLGPAVMVLAVYAILAVTLPATLLRTVVALTAFFAMGYATLALIVDGHVRLSAAEVLAFTVGLTILLTSLSALAVSIVGIPITEFAVVIIGLPIGVLAWLLRRPRTRPWTAMREFGRTYFDFSDYSTAEKGIAAVLLVAIAIALGVFVSLAGVYYPDRSTMGIALTWPNFPGSFNGTFTFGQSQNLTVTVLGDDVGGNFTLRVRLVFSPTNNTNLNCTTNAGNPLRLRALTTYCQPFTIAAGGRYVRPFSIIMEERGTFQLRFELPIPGLTSQAQCSALQYHWDSAAGQCYAENALQARVV